MFYLSDSEWEVMNVLWCSGEMTLAAITSRLNDCGFSWVSNTVHTFLTRLERKGAVEINKGISPYGYRALKKREYYEREEMNYVKRKMFSGSALRMISSLLGMDRLSAQELDALKEFVENKTNKDGKSEH